MMVCGSPQLKSTGTQRGVQIQRYHTPVSSNGIIHIVKSVDHDNSDDVKCTLIIYAKCHLYKGNKAFKAFVVAPVSEIIA